MPVVHQPDGEFAKEMARWEQFPSKWTVGDNVQPGNPYVYRPFPLMLYRAYRRPNGKVECMTAEPSSYGYSGRDNEYAQACLAAEQFNASCWHIVKDEDEKLKAMGQGWVETPQEAIQRVLDDEREVATQAANAAFHAQRMSEQAQKEYAAAEDATAAFVTDVPAPKRPVKP